MIRLGRVHEKLCKGHAMCFTPNHDTICGNVTESNAPTLRSFIA